MKNFVQLVALAVALTVPAAAMADSGSGNRTLFIKSAVEHPDNTATFPLYRGTSQGRTVWYILLDSSNGDDAAALGINVSEKLANARGTTAVQKVRIVNGVVDFPATVHVRPGRQVAPSSPGGFPPSVAEPGAVGEFGYSPLIELPDGTIRTAPPLANATGQADKIVNLDTTHGTVTYRETMGFQNGKTIRYVSTEASNPVAATLENVTFAPALDVAPSPGNDDSNSSRSLRAGLPIDEGGEEGTRGITIVVAGGWGDVERRRKRHVLKCSGNRVRCLGGHVSDRLAVLEPHCFAVGDRAVGRVEVDDLVGLAGVVGQVGCVTDRSVRQLDQWAVPDLADGAWLGDARREASGEAGCHLPDRPEVHGGRKVDHAIHDANFLHRRRSSGVGQLLRDVDAEGDGVIAVRGVEQDVPHGPPLAGPAIKRERGGIVWMLDRALDE